MPLPTLVGVGDEVFAEVGDGTSPNQITTAELPDALVPVPAGAEAGDIALLFDLQFRRWRPFGGASNPPTTWTGPVAASFGDTLGAVVINNALSLSTGTGTAFEGLLVNATMRSATLLDPVPATVPLGKVFNTGRNLYSAVSARMVVYRGATNRTPEGALAIRRVGDVTTIPAEGTYGLGEEVGAGGGVAVMFVAPSNVAEELPLDVGMVEARSFVDLVAGGQTGMVELLGGQWPSTQYAMAHRLFDGSAVTEETALWDSTDADRMLLVGAWCPAIQPPEPSSVGWLVDTVAIGTSGA